MLEPYFHDMKYTMKALEHVTRDLNNEFWRFYFMAFVFRDFNHEITHDLTLTVESLRFYPKAIKIQTNMWEQSIKTNDLVIQAEIIADKINSVVEQFQETANFPNSDEFAVFAHWK